MSIIYLEFEFKVTPSEPGIEILIAELGYAGFESFVEEKEGVKAYIQKSEWKDELLKEVDILESKEFEITYQMKEIEQENWNEEWEKNFRPIRVEDTCAVRAPFHEAFNVPYEIIIEPKMSFGTGHHETTFMMLQFLLENDFDDKQVLDMGCGTAVLAILAKMRGAAGVDAIDIDAWCVENSMENIVRNDCPDIQVSLGDATSLSGRNYHTIIANINRNILLNDLPAYKASLLQGGELYLSGFYEKDLPIIKKACNNLDLHFVENKERNQWVAAKFVHS